MNHYAPPTHSAAIGYVCWLLGFTGAHRFYFGKPVSGAIWFFTFGLLGIGWIIDLFLIPAMSAQASHRYDRGPLDYTVAWIFQTFLGVFGFHRFYMGKWLTGILWLCTGSLLGVGYLYDMVTLNEQVSIANSQSRIAMPHTAMAF